jgi:hypothetical protein
MLLLAHTKKGQHQSATWLVTMLVMKISVVKFQVMQVLYLLKYNNKKTRNLDFAVFHFRTLVMQALKALIMSNVDVVTLTLIKVILLRGDATETGRGRQIVA